MKYNLVTTREGLFPVSEIKEGTEVLCRGRWVKSPEPIKAPVKVLYFDSLPTTAFEKNFVEGTSVVMNREPILNSFEKDEVKLTVKGFINDENQKRTKKDSFSFSFCHKEELSYWYPRFIQYFNKVFDIGVMKYNFRFNDIKFPEITLSGNYLRERNLEYYLEGFLRKSFAENNRRYIIGSNLKESDKLMLRLLNISVTKINNKISYFTDPYYVLMHIRDDFNKSRISEKMITLILKNHQEFYTRYVLSKPSLKIEEDVDWILPGICPDINTLNPRI